MAFCTRYTICTLIKRATIGPFAHNTQVAYYGLVRFTNRRDRSNWSEIELVPVIVCRLIHDVIISLPKRPSSRGWLLQSMTPLWRFTLSWLVRSTCRLLFLPTMQLYQPKWPERGSSKNGWKYKVKDWILGKNYSYRTGPVGWLNERAHYWLRYCHGNLCSQTFEAPNVLSLGQIKLIPCFWFQ